MDKLPVTPSPHRFLLSKSKNKNKAEPHQLGLHHQARQPSALKNPSEASKRVPASPASDFYTSEIPAAPNLTSTSTSTSNTLSDAIAGPSSRAAKSDSATGTKFGGRTEDEFGVGTEELAGGRGNGMNAGTAEGRAPDEALVLNAVATPASKVDGMWKEGKQANDVREFEMPTVKQMQLHTPKGSQFKAAPKFKFGGAQKPGYVSPSGTETGGSAPPHATQVRWRAMQTPLRQNLRRELTEEKIVDGREGEMLMEGVRECVEGQDVDVDVDGEEYGDVTYSQLDAETPAAKRRRVDGDPVESSSHSQSQQDYAASTYQHHEQTRQVLHGYGVGRNNDGYERHDLNDEEMLYSDDHEQLQDQKPFQDLSHAGLSSHPPPATPAPSSHRPRFILPSSHPPRPSTPQPQSHSTHHAQSTFAPTPHFFITTPLPPSTLNDEPQFIKPPKFVHVEEPEPTQPLPEEFSPRKRGQKFVVGGMAGEVRGWLVDLEHHSSSTAAPTRGVGKEERREEDWVVKMVVDDVGGGKDVGWTIARGDGRNVILGGEGIREGLEKGKETKRGSVVGIKAPVWEVEVEGVRWGVGANWKVWER